MILLLLAQTTNSPGCQGGFPGCGKHPHRPAVAILGTDLESTTGWMDHQSAPCSQMHVRVDRPPTRPVRTAASRDAAQAQRNPTLLPGHGSRCWYPNQLLAPTSPSSMPGQRTYLKKWLHSRVRLSFSMLLIHPPSLVQL